MKRVEYNEEKRQILLQDKTRGIDLKKVAEMIEKWEVLKMYVHSAHPNQKRYVVDYNGYPCAVPTVEDKEKIFIKTARLDRKEKDLI